MRACWLELRQRPRLDCGHTPLPSQNQRGNVLEAAPPAPVTQIRRGVCVRRQDYDLQKPDTKPPPLTRLHDEPRDEWLPEPGSQRPIV